MDTKKKDYMMGFLAGIAVLGFFATLSALLFGQSIPPNNREYFALGFGASISTFGLVYNYFFGTSRSSASKDATISKLTSPEEPPPGAPGV